MEDTESCGSRVAESSSANTRHERLKLEAYNEVLRRLKDSDIQEAHQPGFEDELWIHFNRLPARYALDVNVERAEDVLRHKRLLQLAYDPANRPVFDVRLVQAVPSVGVDASTADSLCSNSPKVVGGLQAQRVLPPPTFGSSPNLDFHALESTTNSQAQHEETAISGGQSFWPMHEITYSSDDKPKLLSQLTALLAEIGLNIKEAHAFSTTDGYSLDVFVVDGCPYEETEQLRTSIEKELLKIENQSPASRQPFPPLVDSGLLNHLTIPNDGKDVWEIDPRLLKFEGKVASGSYGDLYKGTYCSQEVAIKVLNPDRVNTDLFKEFAQEVFIMRKVRHKNVVQFIGACTKPPSLCIITEFMSGGSLYDHLHKHKASFKLPSLLRVALDISKGMNYLHQNNIIHRDLKAANLLMDENDVVKVADFGVARVQAQSGVMTAETGTYRWMAPEVIEHKPYDHKADVFSFGIVLWELLTGKIPYEYLTPLQAAVGVVQKGLRPTIPKNTNPRIVELQERCWQQDPSLRPDFTEIIDVLQQIANEVGEEGESGRKEKEKSSSSGFLSALRRSRHH